MTETIFLKYFLQKKAFQSAFQKSNSSISTKNVIIIVEKFIFSSNIAMCPTTTIGSIFAYQIYHFTLKNDLASLSWIKMSSKGWVLFSSFISIHELYRL